MGQLSRRLSPLTLFTLSINAIIGSGWLFAPLYAAKIAGPAAIISWVIAGSAAILIALTFAEISTMLPVPGGTAHIPQLSHGPCVSFILSWIAWITTMMLVPLEIQAVLQYASLFFPSLMYEVNDVPTMTIWGYLWAAILMTGLCVINVVSYKGLVRFNFVIITFKLAVMLFTIFAILHVSFHPSNFAGLTTSITTATGWKAIFSGVAAGGIVLAFNGFKSGVEMAGEAKNLSISVPLGTAGAVLACLLLYIGLQICFIGALDPSLLKDGWQNLNFSGDIGPFVGLATLLGLLWLYKLLYMNAVVSPLGAGLIYVTATARILYAMGRIGYVPKFVTRLNKQRFPIWAIVINFAVGMLSFLPLPGWQAMANFLISAVVITYAMGPIALISLRKELPDTQRPFRLPAADILCLIAFYACNLFSYWTGWHTISKLALVLLIGFMFFGIACIRGHIQLSKNEIKYGVWIVPYLVGLTLISYLGAFDGLNIIPFGWDFVVIGLFSMSILYLALYNRAPLTSEKIEAFLVAETAG